MVRSDAVQAVTGEIFREGWSRVRGSTQGLGQKRQQMVRAAFGHRAAVFKAIRQGGTHTKGQLTNQLNYLTTKSSHIVDSRGVYDGKKTLSQDEIKSVVMRFASRWDEGFNPKLGQTTHLLMSFPRGTKGEHVRDITAGICEQFFQNDDRNFDYLIAVHQDRDHPHAHIVLNRRSQEGELFYLGRDHHFNYDDLRLAMVEEAERFGVRLEATRRVDRGVSTYAPRTKEVYAAAAESRDVQPRERVGADLDRALADIASNAMTYRSLAAEASAENREDIENALLKASAILARNGHLKQNGEVYMANEQSFDELNSQFTQEIQRVSAMIQDAPEGRRAAMQKQLTTALQPVAHMQPLGLRSSTLGQAPTSTGVYSEANINSDLVGKLRENETRAHVETALRGTGISTEAVIDRIEQGADNAALERQWYADDLQKIADRNDLNLERQEDLHVAADRLDQAHVALGLALERLEVIRRDGVVEDSPETRYHYDVESVEAMGRAVRQDLRERGMSEVDIAERADEVAIRADVRIEREQRTYLERHPELLARPGDLIDTTNPTDVRIVDQDRADAIDREIDSIMDRASSRETLTDAIAADMKQRYPDMPDHLARGLATTYVASFELNNRDEIIETERRAALDDDGRARLAERLATDAGIKRAEREGIESSTNPDAVTLSYEDRQELEQIERGFANTDFNYGYADYAPAYDQGRAEVEAASERFQDFAARSPAHAATVSEAWDKATDIVRPPEGYIPARDRIEVRVDEVTAYRDANPDIPLGAKIFPTTKAGEPFINYVGADRMNAALNAQFGEEARTREDYDKALIERYPDIPERLRNDLSIEYSQFRAAEQGILERDRDLRALDDAARASIVPSHVVRPEKINRVVEHERTDRINSPFAYAEEKATYRAEIERGLDEQQIEALKNGDADALSEVIDSRLDRLYAAKAYLQSDEATANSDAVREVVSEINEEEYDAQKLKAVPSHNEKGQTHG